MANSPSSRSIGELRHGVLGSADAIAQSLALLALTFAVSAAPASAAATAGAAVPLAFVIAGVGSLCLASVIVRFTRRIAHAGGLYAYTVRGLGPPVGFLAGWMYATAFALGISFVLILVIALADIRVSTRVQLVFAVIGVVTILALSLAIVAKDGAQGLTWRPFDPHLAPSTHGLFLAVILAFTGFIGFEAAAVLGEEAAEPKRVIPRAILGTVIAATVCFVVDSFVAALAGVHLTARTLFAMGRDRGIPRVFAAVTPRFRSPYVGIAVSVALTLVLGATLGRHYGVLTYFALMATTGSIGILLVYVLVAIAGMVFFWKARGRSGESYNWFLDIVAPLVAVAVCGYTIYASIWPRPPAPISYSLWIALGLLIAGLIILAVLVVTRPDRVRSFGRAFETSGYS